MPSNYYHVLGVDEQVNAADLRDAAQTYLHTLKRATHILLDETQRQTADQQGVSADFYDLLDINVNASAAEIKQAAQNRIKAARHAYQQLADTEQRRLHDAELAKTKTLPPLSEADFSLASRGSRLGATIIDLLALFSPILLALLYSTLTNTIDWALLIHADILSEAQLGELLAQALGGLSIFIIIIGWVTLLMINLILLHRYAQTIGKRLLGIKIVRQDGSSIGLGRITLLRIMPIQMASSILYMSMGVVISVIDALFIFRPSRRCLHDLIADTKVIKCSKD